MAIITETSIATNTVETVETAERDKNNEKMFRMIIDFVQELKKYFTDREWHPLKLYHRLLTRTFIEQKQVVNKHVMVLEEWLETNDEAIIKRDADKLITRRISYTPDKVYIDIGKMLRKCDAAAQKVIWTHITVLRILMLQQLHKHDHDDNEEHNESAKRHNASLDDKIVRLRDNMKSARNTNGNNANGDNDNNPFASLFSNGFMGKIMNVIENKVDLKQCSNPMVAITQLVQSGAISDIMTSIGSNMNTGEFDMGQLQNMMSGMMSDINNPNGSGSDNSGS